MLCPRPINIARPNGKGTADRVNIPCGKCPTCLNNRRESWTIRLVEEYKNSESAIFITLTYNEKHLPINHDNHPSVVKDDFQKFLKRLRRKTEKSIRYYAVAEYGTKTARPHYHAIAFGLNSTDSDIVQASWYRAGEPMGHVHIGTVTDASIKYVTKYHVNKGSYPYGSNPPFTLMSRNPGIGFSYITKMEKYHKDKLQNAFYSDYEFKKALPRYYKEKLYTKAQMAVLASVTEEDYTLEQQQAYNKKYPNGSYFRYRYDNLKAYETKYKEKVNHNNTI